MIKVRNLDWIRNLKIAGHPEAGAKLFEALSDIVKATSNIESQTNADGAGNPLPPPPIQAVNATPSSVGHHISINHGGQFYRGCVYHVEASRSPSFTNPFPVYSGPAREIDLATGNAKLYFQAFASYATSGNTAPVYHGGAIPQVVYGATGGHAFSKSSQSSGTGQPGQGLQGYGSLPFRSPNGVPPGRG